jgi:hypothetical protein
MGGRSHRHDCGASLGEEELTGVVVKISAIKKVAVAIVAASALVLTGCSSMTAAAKIGNAEVTTTKVENSVSTILSERTKVSTQGMSSLLTGANLNRSQLRFFVLSQLLDNVAVKHKISITDGDIASQRSAIYTQIGGVANLPSALVNAGIASTDFDRYLRTILITEKLTALAKAANVPNTNGEAIQALVVEQAKADGVTINPKYGSWDPATADVVAQSTPNTAVSSK